MKRVLWPGAILALALMPICAKSDWFAMAAVLKTIPPPTDPSAPQGTASPTSGQKSQTPSPQTQKTAQSPQPPQQNTGAQSTATQEVTATPGSGSQKTVTNVFSGSDIREAFSEIASATGVTIIPDESIKQTLVYMEFKNEPVESAIRKLALLSGAYVLKEGENTYLVSTAAPDAGLFREFAKTARYRPENQPVASLVNLLSKNYKQYVQSDDKSDLITITAPGELLPQIIADLKKIDSPPRQFVVEALVTEINETNERDLGFSWSWKHFAQGSDLSLTYTQATASDVATIKALIDKGKATLRANPRVTAFEGQQSNMMIGQETYFSILSGNVNFPTAQIQLIKTGVSLTFTGYVADDGEITLNIAPEVSDAIVTVNGNPSTNVRRVSTMVRVRSGDTIAIGGLVQEQTTRSTDKVPLLGYIPIIGELFTNRTNTNKRVENIILITPYLTDTGAGQKGMDSNRKLPPP